MHLNVLQHDFQQHHASTTLTKQQRKPWRHNSNEKKWITPKYVLSLPEAGKLVMLLYDAYMPLVVAQ